VRGLCVVRSRKCIGFCACERGFLFVGEGDHGNETPLAALAIRGIEVLGRRIRFPLGITRGRNTSVRPTR